jgi:hypothetical protein
LPKRYGEKLSVVLDNTLERQFGDEVRIWFGLSSPTGGHKGQSSSAGDMVVGAEIPADMKNSMAGANFAP